MDLTGFAAKPRLVLPGTGRVSPARSWMGGSPYQSPSRGRPTDGPYLEDVALTLVGLRNTQQDKNKTSHGFSPVSSTSPKPSIPGPWYKEIDHWAAMFQGRYYPTEYRLPLAGNERASFSMIWRAFDARIKADSTLEFKEGQMIFPTTVTRSLIEAAQHQIWRAFRRWARELDRQIGCLTPVRFLLPSSLRDHGPFDRFHAFMSLVASHKGLMFAAGRTTSDEVQADCWVAAAHVQHLAAKLLWDDKGTLLSLDDFIHRFRPVPLGPAKSPFYQPVDNNDDSSGQAYASSASQSSCDDTLCNDSPSSPQTENKTPESDMQQNGTPQSTIRRSETTKSKTPQSKTPKSTINGVSERTQREKDRADYLDLPHIGMDALVLCNHCVLPGTRDKGSCRVSQNPHRKSVGRGFACKKCRKTKLNCSFIAIAKEVKEQKGNELQSGTPQQRWQPIYDIQQARNEAAAAQRQRKQQSFQKSEGRASK